MKPALPTSILQMRACLGCLLTDKSIEKALCFTPQADDVFVVTYPKSGTTWMQQIVHGIRSKGDMNFGEICQVVPWIEACDELNQDMERPFDVLPRAYKTHFNYDRVPKGARYIYVVRDPKDVLPSFYHFFEGFMFAPGSISMDEFFTQFFVAGSKSGRYWEHLLSWWPYKDSANCLFLTFEQLKTDLPACVDKVADFIAVELSAAERALVIEQSSFAFMNQHQSHFDDHFLLNNRRDACNLPADVTTSKVRSGQSGGDKGLSCHIVAQLDKIWHETITAKLGFKDYQALRAALEGLSC